MAKSDTIPASAQPGANSRRSLIPKFTWYELLALPVVAVGIAVYWFREPIAAAYAAAHETIAITLGAGVIPIAIWAFVALAALIFKPSLFRRWRLWLASLPLVALAIGAMSLLRPVEGPLAWFTLQGYSTLGGALGDAIAGPAGWRRILQLGGIAALAIALASPVFVIIFAMTFGRLLLFLFIGLVFIAKSVGGIFKRKPKKDPLPQAEPEPAPNYAAAYSGYSASTMAAATNGTQPHDAHPAYEIEDVAHIAAAGVADTDDQSEDEDAHEKYAAHKVLNLADDDSDDDHNYDYDYPEYENNHHAAPHLNGAGLAADQLPDDLSDESLDELPDDEWEDMLMTITDTNSATLIMDPPEQRTDSRLSGLKIPTLGKRREKWAKPSIQLLEGVEDRGVPTEHINETAEIIRQTLADHGVEVEIGSIKYGPTVTMYGIIPGWTRRFKQVRLEDEEGNPILDERGKQISTRQEQKTRVKVSAILSQEKDLALALRTPNLRLETPVMGKAQVGIEIPNEQPAPVTLRSIMETAEYKKVRSNASLPVALGKGTGGENIALDLAKMPHLLIAGATGAGKSVALNAIVSGLLMERSPAELRMLLVDPKRVELTPYNGVPHLLNPVIVEMDEVVSMLKGVINEMMNRYRQMEEIGVRNIEAYNERNSDEPMPFLLVVVDELADLMMTAAADVEQSLCRLAQLGRATGIHLILATQRPSVDVVTGLIKANFPSRISFGVTSHTDSRTILDVNGAEKLLGKGDMLYLPRDAARPLRAQGVFISDEEIDGIINFWQTSPRGWMPEVNLSPVSEDGDEDDEDVYSASTDALFDKAVELAHTQRKLSVSLMQRRLRIGYPRAARLMDELEENGIVGPSDGSKSREVIA